ncbi:MAG TPA: hypothetical protein VGU45_01145 [Microvirga sp.]|jgi:hypothetical protein|nr:hypothetical protein [Microvirga sp.]
MTPTTLRTFTDRVAATGRLSFADLRRLQRDILPDGPQSRAEVEVLLALDLSLERADKGWPDCLVNGVARFVLTQDAGVVDAELAGWLVPVLMRAEPKTAIAVARTVVSAATEVDESLRALAKAGRKLKVAASSVGLKVHQIKGPVLPEPIQFLGLSCSWAGARLGGPVLTARLETGS